MPRLSAEVSGDRSKRPSPVLVSSDHFLITSFATSCLRYPCICVVRAGLLPRGAGFCVPWDLEQNDSLWSPPVPMCVPICIPICIFFLHSGLLWGSAVAQEKNHWTWSQTSSPGIFALPLTGHVTLGIPGIPVECVLSLENETMFFPVQLWGQNERANGKLTLCECHIYLWWQIFQFPIAV